jgi:SH3-like domain-containing protein
LANRLIMIVVAAVLVAGCRQERVELPAERETIAIYYVDAPQLEIRAEPQPEAEVLTSYRRGEPVSVLEERAEWVEIRLGFDRSGWAERARLSEQREEAVTPPAEAPRFIRPPMPVSSSGAVSGVIILEASVNTDGDVIDVALLSDTTNSAQLVHQNTEALRRAKFEPMFRGGRAIPFIYMYRVTY